MLVPQISDIGHLNRLDPRPDLVLITRDLVDERLQGEYANLRRLHRTFPSLTVAFPVEMR